MFGPLGWAYGVMVLCNVLVPQALWSGRVRSRLGLVFAISILVNVGMWFERFVIIAGTLERDFLPSSWAGYVPTLAEVGTLVGSFGLFFTLFLLFCRFVPVIAMSEVKATVAHEEPAAAHAHGAEAASVALDPVEEPVGGGVR
jgi:hypothetical protein